MCLNAGSMAGLASSYQSMEPTSPEYDAYFLVVFDTGINVMKFDFEKSSLKDLLQVQAIIYRAKVIHS